jgi:hypothetical protein
VYDVAPIKSVEGRPLPKEHPVTDRIIALFREVIQRECR